MKLFAFIAFGLLLFSACVTPTPYQSAMDHGDGYSNQKIESNRWSISFSGNSLTDRQTVETYLLYRAAELTRDNGYDVFQIVSRETEGKSHMIATGYSSPFFYNFYGFGPHLGYRSDSYWPSPYHSRTRRHRLALGAGFGGYGSLYEDPFYPMNDYREQVSYEAIAEIIMHKGDKPENSTDYFYAGEVLTNLADSIVLPEEEADT